MPWSSLVLTFQWNYLAITVNTELPASYKKQAIAIDKIRTVPFINRKKRTIADSLLYNIISY